MPPSIWPMTAERVQHPADVLGGGDLDHPDQPELLVDVDDGPVRGEGEATVRVALPVLVERLGRRVVELPVASTGPARRASASDTLRVPSLVGHLAVAEHHVGRLEVAVEGRPLEDDLADRRRRPSAPRRRSSTSGATRDVEPAEPTWVSAGCSTTSLDPEHRAGDLLGERHEALADLGGGDVHGGHPAVGASRHPGGGVVVEPLGDSRGS